MFHFKYLAGLPILVATLFLEPLAYAEGGGDSSGGMGKNLIQRAERRESKRWTLKEWLEQKDRNRMMDMWLSMNAPSPFELMLGGSQTSSEVETTGTGTKNSYTSYRGVFSAYAQFVGLTAEYENNTQESFDDLAGMFNLRLIGHTIQGSYLALHYGQRTKNIQQGQVHLKQQFAQASLQLYATQYFGFDASYRHYLPASDVTLGDVNGTVTEAGAFIDFKNFRIFGGWCKEAQNYNNAGTETNTTRTGIRSGLKIFF